MTDERITPTLLSKNENVKDDLSKSQKSALQNGPRRFLVFDNLIVDIVDYDEEDGAPIVEFSLCRDEKEESTLLVECGICPDIMHRKRLDTHIETHVKYINGIKRFACIYCDEHFASRACAAGHLRRHEGIRPYVCEQCKVYYCTKQDLKMHQIRRHATKEHICEICGKTFAQNSALKLHISSSHEQQRRFACQHCGKRFLRRYAMNEHIRNVHDLNRRVMDCTFCEQVFYDTHKLAQHRREEHLNQRSYLCRACGLTFSTIDFFDGHRRSLQCREKYRQNKQALEQLIAARELQTKQEQEAVLNVNAEEIVDSQTVFVTDEENNKQILMGEGDGEVLYEIAVEDITEI